MHVKHAFQVALLSLGGGVVEKSKLKPETAWSEVESNELFKVFAKFLKYLRSRLSFYVFQK